MFHNPWRYTAPPGWNDMGSAPRDGTVIETQNNYGIAPTFGLHSFENNLWIDANNPHSGIMEGEHLSWREYKGDPKAYVDPTNGRQNTAEYWRQAAGLPPTASGFKQFKLGEHEQNPDTVFLRPTDKLNISKNYVLQVEPLTSGHYSKSQMAKTSYANRKIVIKRKESYLTKNTKVYAIALLRVVLCIIIPWGLILFTP